MLNNIVQRHMRLKPLTETEITIIRSATKLFLQNGYTDTTFKMIEEDSGVKVGTITYHFRSKEDILHILIEEMMNYHAEILEGMHKKHEQPLVAYATEVTAQIALCENNRKAWDLYYSSYSLPMIYDYIKGWAAEKNYNLFKERLPAWTEHDFREKEVIASGIEFAALKTLCDRSFTLDKKITLCLDSMMMLYEVPKQERQKVIETILAMDYEAIAKEMFEKFVNRLDTNQKS